MKPKSEPRVIPRCSYNRTYYQGCRCSSCRKQIAGNNARWRYQDIQRKKGIQFDNDLIDPTPAREAIAVARQNGLTIEEIVRLTQYSKPALYRLDSGFTKRIRRDASKRIITALSDSNNRDISPTSWVDATWTRQMVYALMAQGWSKPHLRDILRNNRGVNGKFLGIVVAKPYVKQTREQNRLDMLWLVSAIGNRSGPNIALAGYMRKRGYFPVKHYTSEGKLIPQTLTKEQKALYGSV